MLENTVIEDANQKEKERIASNEAILKIRRESCAKETKSIKHAKLRNAIKTELMESALNTIFDDCFGNTTFDNTQEDDAFNQSIITNFISDEGTNKLLDSFSERTEFLSNLAFSINEAVDDAMSDFEDIGEEQEPETADTDSYVLDPQLKEDLINNIKGNEELEDIIDVIRFNVSRATEDFIQKNIVDKLNIKDIMYTTKEKLDAIKNGDDVLDKEISQEATIAAKKAIRELGKRPRSIFEQMTINLTERVLSNDQLKEAFTLESGKLDIDKIVKRSTSFYTFLEMVNTLNLRKIDDEYIKEAVLMK